MINDTASAPVTGPTEGDRRQNERRNEDRRKLERVSARGLIALLISVAAIGLAVYALWQDAAVSGRVASLQLEQARFAAASDKLNQDLLALNSQLAVTERRVGALGGLPSQLAGLADSVQELRDRTESGQRAWMLAEARYLLEIANRRLALERDTGAALAAMMAADERLRATGDPGLNLARRRLATEIQSVRALPQPDLAGLAARLAAAEELADDLTVLGAIEHVYVPASRIEGAAPGLGRAWRKLKSSISELVSIRRIGEDAVELVSLEEQGVRRHHLQLLLFASRIAALRGDQPGFRSSVTTARAWLEQMFDPRDSGVEGLARELRELERLDIAPPLPDISGTLALLQRADKGEQRPRNAS